MTTGLDVTPHGYPGAAIPSSLTTTIGPSDTTIQLNSLSGWTEVTTGQPLGSSAAYILAIDYGLSNEEKVLVPAYQTGTVLNDVVRGYDNTLPTTHNAVAVVAPVWSASDAAASNAAVQSISNLGGRGTNPTPTDIEVGGAGTGQPGTSSFAAAADHSHPISTDTINGALTSTAVNGLLTSAGVLAVIPAATLTNEAHVATGITGHSVYISTATGIFYNNSTTASILNQSMTVAGLSGCSPVSQSFPSHETVTLVSTYYYVADPTATFDVSVEYAGTPPVSTSVESRFLQILGVL